MNLTQISSLEVLRQCVNELDFRDLVAEESPANDDPSLKQAPWRRGGSGRKWWQESKSRSRSRGVADRVQKGEERRHLQSR